jgi:threonine synthase
MRYVSTRGEAPALDFSGALLAGLARDGGLYLPENWPILPRDTIAGFAGRPFHEVAAEVLKPFIGGAIPEAVIAREARAAYASFGHPAVTPLVQIGPNRFVLELFHGPTLAFKDVAMQLLARLMDHVLAERGERVTIVGATSGDTGGAAIEAFRGRERADVVILFPDGRVSDVQRRMMTTPREDNVHTLSIAGDFDDCQALVKGMFNHHAFRDGMRLAGVNSINWARIVAQVTYFFVAGAALGAPHRPVSFCVPTGNFGDVFAGYVAKRMGLPIDRLIVATNENDILARTLETGRYEVRATSVTTSPSMDIQVSSNFERLLFDAGGRDSAALRRMMAQLAQSKGFSLEAPLLAAIRADFDAGRSDEARVKAEMRRVLAETGYLLDPHTAVANAVADDLDRAPSTPLVVLATAHPAKFPDAVEAATGMRPALPPRLAHLMEAPERLERVDNDLAAVEAAVAERSRMAAPV